MFETRKEARQYRREHDISGSIHKNSGGDFSIDDKANKVSYTRVSEANRTNLTGKDGVEVAPMIMGKSKSGQLPSYVGKAYDNAIASGEYGKYSPYKTDAFSMSANVGVNSQFFHLNLSLQLAVAGDGTSLLGNGDAGLGIDSSFKPGFRYGFQAALHNNYGGQEDVLDGLKGVDITDSYGLFSHSKSAQVDSNGMPILVNGNPVPAKSGVDSYGVNFGQGLRPSASFGRSLTRSYELVRFKNPLNN